MAKSKKSMRHFTMDNAAHADSCGTKYKLKGYSGRFNSRDPRGAAKKAFTSLCRRKRIRGRCVLYISVRETTQSADNKGKVHTYRFTRRKTETPGPFGQQYEAVGHAVGKIPGHCSKSHKSKGRMFSRTAKGKTGKSMHGRSRSKSSKSRSKPRSKPRSKSSKPRNKSSKSKSRKSKSSGKSALRKLLGF